MIVTHAANNGLDIVSRRTIRNTSNTDYKMYLNAIIICAGRPGGSVRNLEYLLTLGREFGSRCSHTNWDFFYKKKNSAIGGQLTR